MMISIRPIRGAVTGMLILIGFVYADWDPRLSDDIGIFLYLESLRLYLTTRIMISHS